MISMFKQAGPRGGSNLVSCSVSSTTIMVVFGSQRLASQMECRRQLPGPGTAMSTRARTTGEKDHPEVYKHGAAALPAAQQKQKLFDLWEPPFHAWVQGTTTCCV